MEEEKKQPNSILVSLVAALAAFGGYYVMHVYVFGKEFQSQDIIIACGIAVGVVAANIIQTKRANKKKQDDILDD